MQLKKTKLLSYQPIKTKHLLTNNTSLVTCFPALAVCTTLMQGSLSLKGKGERNWYRGCHMHRLHRLRAFQRLSPGTCFPALFNGNIFSLVYQCRLHVLPPLLPVTCFRMLDTCYSFYRNWRRLLVFSCFSHLSQAI